MEAHPAAAFFEILEKNFLGTSVAGPIQVRSESPDATFTLTVDERSIRFAEGTATDPIATITMKENLLADLCLPAVRHVFDRRVVEFSSRFTFSGNVNLAEAILNLVREPSPAVIALMNDAKARTRANPITEVERIHKPARETLLAAIKEFRPIVMSGLLDRWNVSSWNPATLKSRLGKVQLVSYRPDTVADLVNARFSSTGDRKKYSGGTGLPGGMWGTFPGPEILPEGLLGFPQLWLGSSGNPHGLLTHLHCDTDFGLLSHVFGTKKFVLYSPDQEDLLYPVKAFNEFRQCAVSPEAPDYERHPKFRDAKRVDVNLSPGDVLLVPAGWFHAVYADEPVMSIGYPITDGVFKLLED